MLPLCLIRRGDQLDQLSILGREIAHLRLIVSEMEAIDLAAARLTRQTLGEIEKIHEGLLDCPDIFDGEMPWWTKWVVGR